MAIRPKLRARTERGQALVELSLCAGFLCLMLLAVWQVGTVFSNYIDVSEAARSGARAAALSGAPSTSGDAPSLTTAQAEGLFAAVNSANLDASKLEVTIEADPSSTWVAGGKVRAVVKYPYSLSLFGVSITNGKMSVTDVMRIHRQGS